MTITRLCQPENASQIKFPSGKLNALSGQSIKAQVKIGNFEHQVNSDIHLQTLEIQVRRLRMNRLIRIFTVCLINLCSGHSLSLNYILYFTAMALQ